MSAKKTEGFLSRLADRMYPTSHILDQAQSSLTSNGLTLGLLGQKCKSFPGQPLGCACACICVYDLLITEEGCTGS